ncbi:MAG: MarR family transcriptional regulator [Spirochaetaceae bacterium]
MNDKYSNILVEFFERMSSWENDVVSDRDISVAQMHLLEVVGNNGKIRMKELSKILGVTTGTLTVMVHRLASKGYIEKIKDDVDKRSFFIRLKDKGKTEYENHHTMHDHLIKEIIDSLGVKECETFFAQLDKIQKVI